MGKESRAGPNVGANGQTGKEERECEDFESVNRHV